MLQYTQIVVEHDRIRKPAKLILIRVQSLVYCIMFMVQGLCVRLIILFWLCYCLLFILLFYFGYAIVGCSSIYDF